MNIKSLIVGKTQKQITEIRHLKKHFNLDDNQQPIVKTMCSLFYEDVFKCLSQQQQQPSVSFFSRLNKHGAETPYLHFELVAAFLCAYCVSFRKYYYVLMKNRFDIQNNNNDNHQLKSFHNVLQTIYKPTLGQWNFIPDHNDDDGDYCKSTTKGKKNTPSFFFV